MRASARGCVPWPGLAVPSKIDRASSGHRWRRQFSSGAQTEWQPARRPAAAKRRRTPVPALQGATTPPTPQSPPLEEQQFAPCRPANRVLHLSSAVADRGAQPARLTWLCTDVTPEALCACCTCLPTDNRHGGVDTNLSVRIDEATWAGRDRKPRSCCTDLQPRETEMFALRMRGHFAAVWLLGIANDPAVATSLPLARERKR